MIYLPVGDVLLTWLLSNPYMNETILDFPATNRQTVNVPASLSLLQQWQDGPACCSVRLRSNLSNQHCFGRGGAANSSMPQPATTSPWPQWPSALSLSNQRCFSRGGAANRSRPQPATSSPWPRWPSALSRTPPPLLLLGGAAGREHDPGVAVRAHGHAKRPPPAPTLIPPVHAREGQHRTYSQHAGGWIHSYGSGRLLHTVLMAVPIPSHDLIMDGRSVHTHPGRVGKSEVDKRGRAKKRGNPGKSLSD